MIPRISGFNLPLLCIAAYSAEHASCPDEQIYSNTWDRLERSLSADYVLENHKKASLRSDLDYLLGNTPQNVDTAILSTLITFLEQETLHMVDLTMGSHPTRKQDLYRTKLMIVVKAIENLLLLGRAYASEGSSEKAACVFARALHIARALVEGQAPEGYRGSGVTDPFIDAALDVRGHWPDSWTAHLNHEGFGYSQMRVRLLLAGAYKHVGNLEAALAIYTDVDHLPEMTADEGTVAKAARYDYVLEANLSLVEIYNELADGAEGDLAAATAYYAQAEQAAAAARSEICRNFGEDPNFNLPNYAAVMRLAAALTYVYWGQGKTEEGDQLHAAYCKAQANKTPDNIKALLLKMGFDETNEAHAVVFKEENVRAIADVVRGAPKVDKAASNFLGKRIETLNEKVEEAILNRDAQALAEAIEALEAFLAPGKIPDNDFAEQNYCYVVTNLIYAYGSRLYARELAPADDTSKGYRVAAGLAYQLLGLDAETLTRPVAEGGYGFAADSELLPFLEGCGREACGVFGSQEQAEIDKKLALARAFNGDGKKAIRDRDQERVSLAGALQSLADIEDAVENYAGAILIFDRVIGSGGTYVEEAKLGKAECLMGQAKIALKYGDFSTARTRLDEAIEALPSRVTNQDLFVRRTMAEAWSHLLGADLAVSEEEEKKKAELAIGCYQKVIENRESSEVTRGIAKAEMLFGDVHYRLAEAYKKIEDYDTAIENFEEAISFYEDVIGEGVYPAEYALSQVGLAGSLVERAEVPGRDFALAAKDLEEAQTLAEDLFKRFVERRMVPGATGSVNLDPDEEGAVCRSVGDVLKSLKLYRDAAQAYEIALTTFEGTSLSERDHINQRNILYLSVRVGLAEAHVGPGKLSQPGSVASAQKAAFYVFGSVDDLEGVAPSEVSVEYKDLMLRSVLVLSSVYGYNAQRYEESLSLVEYEKAAEEWKKLVAVFVVLLGEDELNAFLRASLAAEEFVALDLDTQKFLDIVFDGKADLTFEGIARGDQALLKVLTGLRNHRITIDPDAEAFFAFGEIFKALGKKDRGALAWAQCFYLTAADSAAEEVEVSEGVFAASDPLFRARAIAATAEIEVLLAKLDARELNFAGAQARANRAITILTGVLTEESLGALRPGQDKDIFAAKALVLLSWAYSSLADAQKETYDLNSAEDNFRLAAAIYEWMLTGNTGSDSVTGVDLAPLIYLAGIDQTNLLGPAVLAELQSSPAQMRYVYADLLKVAGEQNLVLLDKASEAFEEIADSADRADPALYFAANVGLAECLVLRAKLQARDGDAEAANQALDRALDYCETAFSKRPDLDEREAVLYIMNGIRVYAWALSDKSKLQEDAPPFTPDIDGAQGAAALNMLIMDPDFVMGLSFNGDYFEFLPREIGRGFFDEWSPLFSNFNELGIFTEAGIDPEESALAAASNLVLAREFDAAEEILIKLAETSEDQVIRAQAYNALGNVYSWYAWEKQLAESERRPLTEKARDARRYTLATQAFERAIAEAQDAQALGRASRHDRELIKVIFDSRLGLAKGRYELHDYEGAFEQYRKALAELEEPTDTAHPNYARDLLEYRVNRLKIISGVYGVLVWGRDKALYAYNYDDRVQLDHLLKICEGLGLTPSTNLQLIIDLEGQMNTLTGTILAEVETADPRRRPEAQIMACNAGLSVLDRQVYRDHDYGQRIKPDKFLGDPSYEVIDGYPGQPARQSYRAVASRVYDESTNTYLIVDKEAPKIMARVEAALGFIFADTENHRAALRHTGRAKQHAEGIVGIDLDRARLVDDLDAARSEAANNTLDNQRFSYFVRIISKRGMYRLYHAEDSFDGVEIFASLSPLNRLRFTGHTTLGKFFRQADIGNGRSLRSEEGGDVTFDADWNFLSRWAGQHKLRGDLNLGFDFNWVLFRIFDDNSSGDFLTGKHQFNSYTPRSSVEMSWTPPLMPRSRIFTTFSFGAGFGTTTHLGSVFSNDPSDTSRPETEPSYHLQAYATFKGRRRAAFFDPGSSVTVGIREAMSTREDTAQGFYRQDGSPHNVGIAMALNGRFHIRSWLFEMGLNSSLPLTDESSLYLAPKFSVIAPWAVSPELHRGLPLVPSRLTVEYQFNQDGIFSRQWDIRGNQLTFSVEGGF